MCGHKQIRLYGTYMEDGAWITPIDNYNILHYDCPTDEEVKQRVQDAIKEIINEEGFEGDCPLCQLIAGEPYDIVYYCQNWCHECDKAHVCANFDPNSCAKQENLDL